MSYKNPIPSVDDEYESTKYCICFTFEEKVTKSEAVRGINELLEETGGKIPAKWIQMGEPRSVRYALPQKGSDT